MSVSSFIAEMGQIGGFGYRCLWLSPEGEVCEGNCHVTLANGILQGQGYAVPEEIESTYALMYALKWARLTIDHQQVQFEAGGISPSPRQLSEIKSLSIENQKPAYDADTDRLYFSPLKPSQNI